MRKLYELTSQRVLASFEAGLLRSTLQGQPAPTIGPK